MVDLIEEHPELGAVADDLVSHGSFRRLPSPPYRVIYRLTESEIWIARIWDTRRDPSDLRVLEDARSPDGAAAPAPPREDTSTS